MLGVNPPYRRHPRSINPYTGVKTALDKWRGRMPYVIWRMAYVILAIT
jgi:hypothetical protein